MGLFTSRNVRPQFVSDWQVRATGLPGVATENLAAWPTTVDFLVYAAGTFLHGTGLQLDLGVIRDSVLNAENDYSAVWAEECHLIAKVGHASRRYTGSFNVGGNVAIGVTGAKV
jgi:anaerobic glycerol-3-phosphate dehydrogenase